MFGTLKCVMALVAPQAATDDDSSTKAGDINKIARAGTGNRIKYLKRRISK